MRWMMVTATALAGAVTGSAALAETLRCQSQGYCTSFLECNPDSAVMRVEVQPDGSARYGWIESEMFWFEAPGLRKGAMRVWVTPAENQYTQTLAISDSGEGTFQIVADLDGTFYASMQVLVCRGK